MSNIPPVEYPRNNSYGSAAQLKALYEGYHGLSLAFLGQILISIAFFGLGAAFRGDNPFVLLGIQLVVFLAYNATIVHTQNKKIAFGAGWPPANAIVATVLMVFSAFLCCGIAGYIVMQTIAMNHIKKYGLRAGFFGIKKPEYLAKLAELESTGR